MSTREIYYLSEPGNGPVRLRDIVVYPGDLIVADDSGVCVVPTECIAKLIDEAESIGTAEDKMRELIVDKAPVRIASVVPQAL